ncbi:hypothetical protein [Cupriavidus pinatubonensis]|uniref:Uncharacterized protein n=1 Tax=Cupriavidus pinatubonensis TaxID=248026 RepID=A0ABN7XSW3_9BURK|nr:hypothetical protein [Cupriavidus pinatubonensis]CAG9163850.1 hypothetical protein LMG23994_00305 [Cupriavidus pinatubonensis]
MSRYRKVDTRIWNDSKFRDLTDDAKLVFFMLLTHPGMTSLGAMRASVAGLAEELGWEAEAFRKAFGQVIAKGMAEHDGKACLVALPNFQKYNSPESPNVVKAWAGALDLLPECELKTLVVARSAAFAKGMSEGFAKALPEAFAKGMPYQEQEQEQEQEQDKNSNPNGLLVDSEAADLASRKPKSVRTDCPHQEIIAAYHELLPMCPAIRDWTPARQTHLRARWNEDPKRQSLGYWRKFFAYIAQSDFLTGKANAGHGRSKAFIASLDWLVKAENFTKIREGRYHEQVAA